MEIYDCQKWFAMANFRDQPNVYHLLNKKQLLIVTTKSPSWFWKYFLALFSIYWFSGWVYFFFFTLPFLGESYIFLLNATVVCDYFCLIYYFLTLSNHHMCCLYFQLSYKTAKKELNIEFIYGLLRTAVPVFFVCLIGSRRVIYFP